MEMQEQFEALVAKGVVKALAPYKEAILAMADLVRSAAPDAPEKRPAARKKEAKPRVVDGAVEAAARAEVGQKVHYRQGRGEFEATVEAINRNTGVLSLKRIEDGKIVERPATKVLA